MPIRPPTEERLREIGERLYMDLSEEELEFFCEMAEQRVEYYETVRSYDPEPRLGGRKPRIRSAGRRPPDDENPNNGWVTRCEVRGNDGGDLAGTDVAIKDNVCVAGVEMTCGSQVVEGYVPNVDATIVSRLLAAGADIVGKTNMDDMATSATGHSAFGEITNPRDDRYLAGGSSGGSAVVVANGDADAAIGTDQGGSVRIPAAFCGIVGHKPTYGLVPYTGCMGLEHTIDHPGPMGPDARTVARVLTTIAGSNEKDIRRAGSVPTERYQEALDGDASELSIGLLTEGFEQPNADSRTVERVREAVDRLAERGATVEEVSVPMHADAEAISTVCSSEGLVAAMSGEGVGHTWKAWYNASWVDAFGKFRRAQSDDFPASLKMALLMGAYVGEEYHSRYYASGMNLVLELIDRYDEALAEHDLLAMPTVLHPAPERVPEMSQFERMRELRIVRNTAPFNRTGHPAVSVPAGEVDGLPVGLQLVGPKFDDATVLKAADALERERPDGGA